MKFNQTLLMFCRQSMQYLQLILLQVQLFFFVTDSFYMLLMLLQKTGKSRKVRGNAAEAIVSAAFRRSIEMY